MWYPGQGNNEMFVNLILDALGNDKVKAEIKKYIKAEVDKEKVMYKGNRQTYDSLTQGSVKLQESMAVSGYDVYGKTILKSNYTPTNNNTYKKMKNKIKYGKPGNDGFRNRGQMEMS